MNIECTVSFQQNIFHLLLCLDNTGSDVGTLFEIHIGIVMNLEDVIRAPIVIDVCLEDIILVGSKIFRNSIAVCSDSNHIACGDVDFRVDKDHQSIESGYIGLTLPDGIRRKLYRELRNHDERKWRKRDGVMRFLSFDISEDIRMLLNITVVSICIVPALFLRDKRMLFWRRPWVSPNTG